jgi:hypothetical protein
MKKSLSNEKLFLKIGKNYLPMFSNVAVSALQSAPPTTFAVYAS